jgi:enamine deaminase RidA (YjgF/YER057c/UK114 family)
MFKALVTRAETAEQYAARENQAARDWMAAAEAAKSGAVPPQPAAPPTGQKPSDVPTTGSAGKAADRVEAAAEKAGVDSDVVLKAVDWKLFKQIHDTEGPDVATLWAISGVVNKINQQWEQKFNDYRKPQEEQAAAVQTIKEVRALFTQAMVAADSNGRQYYPELSDPVAADEIGKVFVQLGRRGLSKDYLVSPDGVHMTILRWRDWRNATNNPWSATTAAPTTQPGSQPAGQPPSTGSDTPLPQDTLDAARQLLASLESANVSPGSISPSGAGQHRNNGGDQGSGKKGAKILRDMKQSTKQTQDWGYSEE